MKIIITETSYQALVGFLEEKKFTNGRIIKTPTFSSAHIFVYYVDIDIVERVFKWGYSHPLDDSVRFAPLVDLLETLKNLSEWDDDLEGGTE